MGDNRKLTNWKDCLFSDNMVGSCTLYRNVFYTLGTFLGDAMDLNFVSVAMANLAPVKTVDKFYR